MTKFHTIAFYLPQYHPIKENNEWFGEGFTEWTNVCKAKPLFSGHYQPKLPTDLGYYDLRIPEVRQKQADLAKAAGIDAFCYYHYWFGYGKQLMEMPLNEVVRVGEPNFPFCLCWANHSFYKKNWNSDTGLLENTLLLEQTYPGEEDIINHFYSILHILKDKRYYRIGGKMVFVLYDSVSHPQVCSFIKIWNNLALKEGLGEFYFLTYCSNRNVVCDYPFNMFDGVILSLINNAFSIDFSSKFKAHINGLKTRLSRLLNKPLSVRKYSSILPLLTDEVMKDNKIIPTALPNWDMTPRRGLGSTIMTESTPTLFKKHFISVLNLIKDKPLDNRIVFIKSWNEWGEGNYLEPDAKYGHGFLRAIRESLDKFND